MAAEKQELFFKQLYNDYKSVRKLLDDDSKSDPETEPYKSKYAARVILKTMLYNLKNVAEDLQDLRFLVAHGIILLNLGIVGVDTDELNEGEKNLLTCIDLLTEKQSCPEIVVILLNAYNQMGLVWSNRNDIAKAKSFLLKATVLYKDFKALGIAPIEFGELFEPDDKDVISYGTVNIEKAYTLTLYYLAQVYGSLKDHLKSAIYCHITLKRQIELSDYDSIDWALNAATLSQFFMEKNGFKQSRHHLAAASYVMDKYGESLGEDDAKKEQFNHRHADVSRCWTKYCLGLLSASKDRLMDESDGSMPHSLSAEFEKLQLDEECQISKSYESLNFDKLSLSTIENQVSDQFVLTFDDARGVFLICQKWIDSAKEYYTLENHATDYCEVIQDRSSLYKILAFFEEDDRRQAAMHKRRVDLLEPLVQELNPEYYGDVCRQLWFELGETYSDILDIKLDKLKNVPATDRPSPNLLCKINALTDNAIKYFKIFIESVKEKSTGDFPKSMPAELFRPLLLGFFHLGRLHVKYVVLDKNIQLRNTEESLACYKKFVEFCDLDEKAADIMKSEIGVCREMIALLPYKVTKLQREIGH